jgi:diadenylate cyclase
MIHEPEHREALLRVIRIVAPGTVLSEGLEYILRARTGALIVVSDSAEVMALVNGGFHINADLTPSCLYELAKMDGAMVLSSDATKVLIANAQLTPDPLIPTLETGTRHRTAERMAVQTGELIIAISQRRGVISLYYGNAYHTIREIGTTLAKANQALQTLQKYKSVLEQELHDLSALEFEDLVTLADVCIVTQRAAMVERIADEIRWYITELGTEGRLVSMQLEELIADVEDEGHLVQRDYFHGKGTLSAVHHEISNWDDEALLDLNAFGRILGYSGAAADLDTTVTPRGFRILRKIPRLPLPVIDNLVKAFKTLPKTLQASIEELDEVDGIGEVRARAIREGLRRLKEQVLRERSYKI